MTSTSTATRTRRIARNASLGALAVTAAVALPAFALDRGGDGGGDAVGASTTEPTAPSTTTTTMDPAQAEALRLQQSEAALAAIAAMPPEQQFALIAQGATPEERAAFAEFDAGLQDLKGYLEELNSFQAWVDSDAGPAAQAQRARDAAAQQKKQEQQQQSRRSSAPAVAGGSVWDSVAQCETGGNWSHPTVSGGFSGGLMFHYATWNANGGQAYAATASGATREQQIVVAERILAQSGWGAWPGCSRKLGLR